MNVPIIYGSVCSGIEAFSKSCTHCGETKALIDFHHSKKSGDGRASWCKRCVNTMARASRKRNYDRADKRRWQLNTRYRLTPESVATMLEQQGGVCKICATPPARPCIDHDHNTGAVRGILCHSCNIKLGGWDDIKWRRCALQYLGLTA